jgi:HK97 gp10 family phage protein
VPTGYEVIGVEEVEAKLKQVADDLGGGPMVDAMKNASLIVMRDARKLSPVDTGRLRASIAPDVRREGKSVMGVVGSNVKYAPFQELGTGTQAGRGRHWPPAEALETWARRHGFASGFIVARAIGLRGGLKAKRFLQRAVEQNKDKIVKLVDNAVKKIVDK